nr:autophagy-related protein 17 [Quercus suber]
MALEGDGVLTDGDLPSHQGCGLPAVTDARYGTPPASFPRPHLVIGQSRKSNHTSSITCSASAADYTLSLPLRVANMSSSDVSPSPPASPSAAGVRPEPTVEQLVRHFIAAKRALTATSHGWRANELVTSSRSLIEEIAILNAKNSFARRTIEGHVETLQNIRDGVADAGKTVTDEFKKTIADLDLANGRLQDTLKSLRTTVLHASLLRSVADQELEQLRDKRTEAGEEVDSEDEDGKSPKQTTHIHKTLHDFILESDHEDILASLRALIDSFQEAHGEFDDDLATFDQTRSLIAHYDLCVSALKHTEGGGPAAYLAAQAAHLTKSSSTAAGAEESLYRKTVPEPISRHERGEMLAVLTSDAEEVDDVVAELQDRSAEMETTYAALVAHATRSRSTFRQLRAATATLQHLRATALPQHVAALRSFTSTWKTLQAEMASRTGALVALTDFHVHFLDAYARLLVEIERREGAEARMRKVADKAQRELERLWELDGEAREAFMEDAGRFLPGDLYPAIGSGARKWMILLEDATVLTLL